MSQIVKYTIILLVLMWSVCANSKADELSAIYVIKDGRLIPLSNTSKHSDIYMGRSTNSKIHFTKMILDKNGVEIK